MKLVYLRGQSLTIGGPWAQGVGSWIALSSFEEQLSYVSKYMSRKQKKKLHSIILHSSMQLLFSGYWCLLNGLPGSYKHVFTQEC